MQVQRQHALKQIFMKSEFENSIRRLSILCRIPDIRIAWINPFFEDWGQSVQISTICNQEIDLKISIWF